MKYQHGVLSVSGAALWGSISISPISPRCEWHCQCHRWWWGGDCALWSITIWQFEERSHGFLRSGGKRRGGVNIYGERSSASQRRENLHGERSEGSKCRILSPSLWMINPISSNYVQPDFPMRKKPLVKRSHFLLVCSKRSPKHYSSAIFFYFTLMVILIVQNERKTGVTRKFPLVLIHQSSPHKFKLNIPHRATS